MNKVQRIKREIRIVNMDILLSLNFRILQVQNNTFRLLKRHHKTSNYKYYSFICHISSLKPETYKNNKNNVFKMVHSVCDVKIGSVPKESLFGNVFLIPKTCC